MCDDGGMRVMDSHLHLWDPAVLTYDWLEGPLDGAFGDIEINEEQLTGVEEEAAIFVQADPVEGQAIEEVRWVESIALASGVVAIVAGARLDRGAETIAHLDALGAFERVIGVRHLLQGEPDGFAGTAAFLDGARAVASRGLTFDACVRSHQLADVTALAAAVPDLPIVLDHLGKPQIGAATAAAEPEWKWKSELRTLARHHSQVYCKLSGLPAEAGGVWTAAQIEPFLDVALDAFGPDRLMWGSDWPVSSVDASQPALQAYLPGDRQRWFETVAEWASSRGVPVEPIFWDNALTFYRLQ